MIKAQAECVLDAAFVEFSIYECLYEYDAFCTYNVGISFIPNEEEFYIYICTLDV